MTTGAAPARLTERVLRIREFGIIAVLLVFVAVTAGIQHRFISTTNIQFILVNTTVFALLALGETMVVISRNVDLSVGSVLGLSAYLSADLFGHVHGIPVPVVFLAGLGIGLGCGMLNGLMVSIGRVPSLVVTLATLYIIRGIDILVVGGNIAGYTRTMTTAIALETSKGNLSLALGLGFVLIGISIAVSATVFALGSEGKR